MQKLSFRIIVFFVILNSTLLSNEVIENNLKKISYIDRISLRFFFREFFLKDALGHVLFFETKPIATTGIFKEKHRPIFKHFVSNLVETIHDKFFENGWNAWKKYKHLFPHVDFIFAEDETITCGGEKILNIYIINKKTLKNCLFQYQDIFDDLLNENFSAEEFMQRLEIEKQILPLINYDDSLLGILLGYGLESSLAFKNEYLQINYSGISIPTPENCPIWPLGFMGNSESPSIHQIVKTYEKEMEYLYQQYLSSPDLLIMILQQLSHL